MSLTKLEIDPNTGLAIPRFWGDEAAYDYNLKILATRALVRNADGTLSGASAGAVRDSVAPPAILVQQAFAAALALRGQRTTPAVPATLPTTTAGNKYFIDPLHPSASDSNNGTSPETPWVSFHKISGLTPGSGGVVHVACDGDYVYADTWAAYKTATKFPYNNADNLNGSAAAPVTIRPYNPRRVANTRPRISWYAAMQAADWTQEAGYGGNVWSAAWVKAGNATNGYRKTLVAYGPEDTLGEAPGHDQNGPSQLTAPGQYAVDGNKVYMFSPGVNPVAYYGSVKVLGGNTIFGTAWNGMRFLRVLGLQFDLCQAFNLDFASNLDVTHGGVEVAYCGFRKAGIGFFRNQQSFAGGKEMPLSVHDNEAEDAWGGCIQMVTAGAGNTISWEVYRNAVDGCNLNSGFGAFLYNQSKGGTKKIAWGNYIKRALNGVGTQIDGSAFYNDLGSNSGSFVGNVIEQSGVPIQANSCTGMWAVANLFIDCWMATQVTGTGTDNTPDMIATVAQNTWLWTGRLQRTSLRLGSQIGSASPVYAHWNDQWLSGSRKFANYAVLNNAAVNAGTGEQLRPMIRYEGNGIATLALGGNASLGLSGPQAVNVNNGVVTDVTLLNEHVALMAPLGRAKTWLLAPNDGNAALALQSPLAGAGVPLNVAYSDIAGRAFAAVPSIGCLEAV